MNDIVLTDISKAFEGKEVLKNLSLRFCAGETACIQGRSGIGKTTLLRIIAGLTDPDRGTVEGVPERIGFVFQEDRLCEDFSVLSNIRLVTGRSMPKEQILRHLAELELEDCASRSVRELSGGMKRRLALARAVCSGADLIILDEPFKGMDAELKIRIMDYVKRHCAGKTVICVTHELSEAAYLGDRIIDLDAAG